MNVFEVDYNYLHRDGYIWDGQSVVTSVDEYRDMKVGERVLTREGDEGPCEGNICVIADYGRGIVVSIRLDFDTWEKET